MVFDFFDDLPEFNIGGDFFAESDDFDFLNSPVIASAFEGISKLANDYLKKLDEFKIIPISSGSNKLPAIIFINGFLQKNERPGDWLRSITPFFPDNAKFHLNWDSKNTNELYDFISKYSEFSIDNISEVALKFILEYWYSAQLNADKAGVVLSEILKDIPHRAGFILMGHSLGCRVAYHTVNELAKLNKHIIHAMYLLSGAIGIENWYNITDYVKDRIYNYYAPEDVILKYVYQSAGWGIAETPIGIAPIHSYNPKIINCDVSRILERFDNSGICYHMRYKDAFKIFLSAKLIRK